jgi:hypothetical protein
MHHVTRGYFGLQDNDHIVHVTSDKDFVLHIWARNVETFHGGIQITTPPSQFRGVGSTGPDDGLVLDVPPETGMDLGCIGARDHRYHQRLQRPRDDLSHGCHIRSEQCHHDARVALLPQR